MIEQSKEKLSERAEINPYISTLAGKLMKNAANANVKFDSDGWQLITEVLSYAATAEQRMAEQESRINYLEQLSVTDELTGIPNRRGLRAALGRALSSAARHSESGVLGFIDLDGFKAINDEYGHSAGDLLLRRVAKLLTKLIRPVDIVARISGDEFAIILTRCSEDQGRKRLRAIQRAVNELTIEFADTKIPAKCSLGIQPFNGATDPAELIEAADMAMYNDKQTRRGKHLRTA
ncbi:MULTISPECIES: GGDEF domain-containing protein [Kordiimonas]|uniref:GGDEF domain-containing protein n=1 Tax=Kordiimonas TaxID=288021 RepID=UPI001FF5BE76|nr:GGDEF domain-containing protein [Kordiimonas sp. SCSIO 12603]MCK0069554.1 GGDEF domain-containing protein [Kordiimonas laminariae]UTW57021.1 GGDEF domain-containing protein [Kordiimonas sp. SCSIO 12603]